MKYVKNITRVIGNTPLVKLNSIGKDSKATLLAKLEYLNPGGSMKDRIGLAMIEDAEKKGLLKKGGTIVEQTGGNTGIGLALAGIAKGYKVILTLSGKMSLEKELILKAYGAEVVRCPAEAELEDPENYINVARRIAKETPGAYMMDQHNNMANPRIHYETTGPEIWRDTDGRITHFIAPIGTGGLMSGVGKYLKEKNPKIRTIGVDPAGSMLNHYFYKTKGKSLPYFVEGPGEDFLPGVYDMTVIDEVLVVPDKNAFLTARELVAKEGIFAGGSSGMVLYAALQIAKDLSKNDIVVMPFNDSGKNYVSKIYNDAWMKENNLL